MLRFRKFSFAALSLVLAIGTASAQPGADPSQAPKPQGQNPKGMHIYLWAGLKSHGIGQHDYPQFLADWSKLLTEHGAVVSGALHSPGPGGSRECRCNRDL